MMNKYKTFKGNEFLFGVCYYPEHWEEALWEDDFRRIKETGFNVVRMGETAWNIFEPKEGIYSFEMFDKAIKLCEKYNLKVIMGTPTYAPPAWLTSKYPEVLRADFHGVLMQHGSRRHYNYTSKKFLELSTKIVTKIAEHFADNKTIIGWQIDNELNCHMDVSFAESDHCAFRQWCIDKYKKLETLNKAWGTAFWAQTYTDWDQVYLPRPTVTYHNPGHILDFYKFTSEMTIAFAASQYNILKNYIPESFITHNGIFNNIDNYEFTKNATDFMSFDSYPAFQFLRKEAPKHFRDRMQGKSLSRVRGFSEKFLILEQQAGPGGQSGNVFNQHSFGDYLQQTPKPGQMRLWTWQSIAHGADGVLYFRWRTCNVGSEALWHGLNDYGNRHNRRLDEARQVADEISLVGKTILESTCKKEAAIIYDYDNDSNCKIDGYIGSEEWGSEEAIYRSLSEKHYVVDMLSEQCFNDIDSLLEYKLLFYPNAQLLEASDAQKLKEYVERGGTLVVGPRSGYKDRSNRCYMLPFPGVIKELSGIEVTDFTMISGDEDSNIEFLNLGKSTKARVFNEILEVVADKAEIIAVHTTDYYKGKPAIVKNKVGKGQIIYFGTFFTKENTDLIIEALGFSDNLAAWADIPCEIEGIQRSHKNGDICMLLNYTQDPKSIIFKEPVKELIKSENLEGTVEIEPYGVWMIQRSNFAHKYPSLS